MSDGLVSSGICAGILAVLLLVILLPLSFQYVNYYEYGLRKRRTSGTVNTGRVYTRGRYNLGPDNTMLKYQADAHILELDNVDIFSDGGDSVGLSFSIDVHVIYFLKAEEVGNLHKDLAKGYEAVVKSRTIDAIKNSATSVTFTDYFQNRKGVEKQFKEAIEVRWNEPPELYIELDQFYLGRIRIPESVARKQLEARVQNERNDKEKFLQDAQLEREKTAVDVNKIELETDQLLDETNAKARRDTANARSDADKIRATARNTGTLRLLEAVNITNQKQTIAYTYIRNLQNRESLDLAVNYLSDTNVVKVAST